MRIDEREGGKEGDRKRGREGKIKGEREAVCLLISGREGERREGKRKGGEREGKIDGEEVVCV